MISSNHKKKQRCGNTAMLKVSKETITAKNLETQQRLRFLKKPLLFKVCRNRDRGVNSDIVEP